MNWPPETDGKGRVVLKCNFPDDGPAPPAGEWRTYRKTAATWAVKLPVDVTVPTSEGEMEADGGDYLCIDPDGGLYPVDGDLFERMYEETEGVE